MIDGSGGASKYSCCPTTSAAVAPSRSGPQHIGQVCDNAAKALEKRKPQSAHEACVMRTVPKPGGSSSRLLRCGRS
jgi:hypothetical protein